MGHLNHYGRFGFIIKGLLDKLNLDEKNVYCLVRGLGDGYNYSYSEAAKILNTSESRIRTIEKIVEYKINSIN